jgi:hypothetical protein
MRQDLSEGAFNHPDLIVPKNTTLCQYPWMNPHNIINQDRAHIVIRLHWKLAKHGRHGSLFVPGWHTTSVLTLRKNTTYSG